MNSNVYQTPDLATILSTLATLAPARPHLHQQIQNSRTENLSESQHSDRRYHTYQPPSAYGSLSQTSLDSSPSSQPEVQQKSHRVESSSITDWSKGLRHTIKLIATNENITKDIQKMIKTQHEHEVQWSAGRQMLIQKQGVRKVEQDKLDEVLRAIGGMAMQDQNKSATESAEDELRTFDLKVHRAQTQMVIEMTARLRAWDIPFFSTSDDLVRENSNASSEQSACSIKSQTNSGGKAARITASDLLALQKRMIQLLEELCEE